MSVISISALLRCHTCKVERGSIVMAFLTIKLAERKPLAMPITVRPSVELNTGSMIFPLVVARYPAAPGQTLLESSQRELAARV